MRAARTDANQTAIVEALRADGRIVAVTSKMGDGFPDLVVASRSGKVWLMEIKDADPEKYGDPYSMLRWRLLTDEQVKFFERWPAAIPIVFTAEEAVEVTNLRARTLPTCNVRSV